MKKQENREIAAVKLDRLFPVSCQICSVPMPRCDLSGKVIPHDEWRICKNCNHDNCGPEAATIAKHKNK